MSQKYPRITIEYCTQEDTPHKAPTNRQCQWMLRSAYFAQELLSTFSTAIGEIALQPSTGGRFVSLLGNPLELKPGGHIGYGRE